MSVISAATTGWTTRSSAPRPISLRGCNRSREPGHIVVSYETYALVRDIVVAHELPPITMKGISREVVPYAVDGVVGAAGETIEVFSEHQAGLDFYLNAK